jgi:hypothetical protein
VQINIRVAECSEALNYLEASARIRGVSVSKLLQVLVNNITRDQLVLAVLDDAEDLKRISDNVDHSSKRQYRVQYH